jgi:hypothetical protein
VFARIHPQLFFGERDYLDYILFSVSFVVLVKLFGKKIYDVVFAKSSTFYMEFFVCRDVDISAFLCRP